MIKFLAIFLMLLTSMACARMQPMTPRNISYEISQINMELPRRINENTTLERVSHDEFKSALVCHYTVDIWDGVNVVAGKQSTHQFCDVMEEQHRDYLFSMADTIEFEYRTVDGSVQYEFVADENTCK